MSESASAPAPVIVGYSCRLPGANSPQSFWDLLCAERSAISEIGPDRFSTQRFFSAGFQDVGTSYTFRAGLIDEIWEFDPGFFGFSHREARQMDPQQRLLLQTAWEAIEHAGLRPAKMDTERTGVYIGGSAADHSTHFVGDPARVDAPFMLGNTLSILSNRISYAFNLKGPSYTVDTACSSSFYALDQARRALDSGEIDTAIVGAVNVLLSPISFVGFARAAMLSPDGMCKYLDADANGYVRGEGAVVFVLRRADMAAQNGDKVRSRLVATGINSDGRTTGLALPSASRQAALMSQLKEAAGVDPNDIAFVEAHGTGTRVGDLAEATSLGEVYGRDREAPLPIGSAKTNVGHLEPASGLVGLLKAQLSLEHGMLPASLNISERNPEIDFVELNITPVTKALPLPVRKAPMLAAVNSFGFGGANAHAIIAAGDTAGEEEAEPCATAAPLIVSAATAEALRDLSAKWAEQLREADDNHGSRLINQAAWRRERLAHTLVATGESPSAIGVAIKRHLAGESASGVVQGRLASAGRTAFVFSGNGAQWAGMGCHLYDTDPVFRAGFRKAAELFLIEGGADLVNLLSDPELDLVLDRATVGQALLFAIQVGLVESLEQFGVQPDAVAGHSVGEVAAAWCAGALSLGDAVRLIQARASALEDLHGSGCMAAVLIGAEELETLLEAFQSEFAPMGSVTLAAVNNPRSSTISGSVDAIEAFGKFARSRRVAVKQLDVPYPYHSSAVDAVRADMLNRVGEISPRPISCDYVSSTDGAQLSGEKLGREYWWRNTREPVLFKKSIECLTQMGCRAFIEIGPRPVLQSYIVESATAAGCSIQLAPTLEQGRRQTAGINDIVARILAIGARHDESRVYGLPLPFQSVLPSYPWQQAEFRALPTGAANNVAGSDDDVHPLLGWCERADIGVWMNTISLGRQPWLADHNVAGAVVFPAAGFAEMMLAAGAAEIHGLGRFGGLDLSGLDILQPLVVDGSVSVRTIRDRETGTVTIESCPFPSGSNWVLNARARVRALPEVSDTPHKYETSESAELIDAEAVYASAEKAGLNYGASFRCFKEGRLFGSSIEFTLSQPLENVGDFVLDPRILDGGMHGLLPLLTAKGSDRNSGSDHRAFLPVRFGRLRMYRCGIAAERAVLHVERFGVRSVTATLKLFAADGLAVAHVNGLTLREVPTLRRAMHRARFWRQKLQPLRSIDDKVALPATWLDPASRIRTLGIATSKPVEDDDGTVLSDAAARRLVWDTVSELALSDGVLDGTSLQDVAPSAYPLLGRMLLALEEDQLFMRDSDVESSNLTGKLASSCVYPSVDELLVGLHTSSPDRVGELMALSDLSEALPEALRSGLTTEVLPADPLEDADVWPLVISALTDLADGWDADRRLSVLLVGTPPLDFISSIVDHQNLTNLTLTDLDPGSVELMGRMIPRHPSLSISPLEEISDLRPEYDALIVSGRCTRIGRSLFKKLHRHLMPAGIFLGVERAPDLLGDLLGGRSSNWWRQDTSFHQPVSKRRGREALGQTMTDAGFADVSIQFAAGTGKKTLIASALGSSKKIETTEKNAPLFRMVFHERDPLSANAAVELREALSCAEGHAPKLSLLSPLIEVPDQTPWEGVVLFRPQPANAATSVPVAVAGISNIQTLLERLPKPERLWVVLPGGSPGAMNNADESPAMAALWGYTRTLVNELPDVDIRLIDPGELLLHDDSTLLAERLAKVIQAPETDRELYLGVNGIWAPRVEPVRALDADRRSHLNGASGRRLTIARVGGLDDLKWSEISRREPGENEVEIAVRAAGLNFRDVMWAQGLLPEEALEHGFAGPTLGMECAGVVVRAGRETGLNEGERVAAFAASALSSHVTTSASSVVRIPDNLSFDIAACLPVVCATAQYALIEQARIKAGEQILIHGGAGGVGLAALQIAKTQGARVIATAGTPAKRRLLRAFGADAVFDSRNLQFSEQVIEASNGGVDVVLNSLAGEAMERSIGCLRPFGRFVELGKRDFFADTRVGLRPFHRNLSYFGVDLDELIAARPDQASRLMEDVSSLMRTGDVKPLPYTAFESDNVGSAFRLMQKSRHVGKIIIRPPRTHTTSTNVRSGPETPVRGGWLVIGGTRGFGLSTALELAKRGAAKLWLASQSGEIDSGDSERFSTLSQSGVAVEIIQLDVSDRDAVAFALEEIQAGQVPLRGVVHSAMVLRDAPASALSPEDVYAVLAPKVSGAEHLDRLTRNIGLDHFIMFSSAVTLFGNPRQSAYVAANMALERIAAGRRKAGDHALAIGWGALGNAGYLSRDSASRELLDKMLDGAFLSEEEALAGLQSWQSYDLGDDLSAAAVSFAKLPWSRLAGDLPILETPLFDRLDEPHERVLGSNGVEELRQELLTLEHRAALKLVTELLISETAAVLQQPASEIDPKRPLGEIGFDSLMAVELRLLLEEKVGVSLPLLSLADATTLVDVAVRVLKSIRDGDDDESGEDAAPLDDLIAQHVTELTLDDESKDVLRAKAESLKSLG